MITIKLSQPVTSIDRELTELTFRAPVGRDLIKAGFPMNIEGGGMKIDAEAMTVLMARCASVPRTVIESLPIADWTACMNAVMGFLGPVTSEESSNSTSTAPGSGAIN